MCDKFYYATPISSGKQKVTKPIFVIRDAQASYCASAKIGIP